MVSTGEEQEVRDFYHKAITLLKETGCPFMLGGAFAVFNYTGLFRNTKDLDIFCRPRDYVTILKYFSDKGFKTEITDSRWLAKIFFGEYFVDVIFDTVNNICTVDDSWLEHATVGELFGLKNIKFLSPEDLIWCKIYVQNRERFDGADINHVIVRYGHKIDWNRLLLRLDQHWQLLLAQIVIFQFCYPAERDIIPKWLFDELIKRANDLYSLDPAKEKVCRGPIIDQTQYKVDIKDWDYKVVTIKTV